MRLALRRRLLVLEDRGDEIGWIRVHKIIRELEHDLPKAQRR